MKYSYGNARIDRAGKHNDRNFNTDFAAHIDTEKSKDNLYWTYTGDLSQSFSDIELDYYEQHFSDYVENQNNKNKASRNTSRNMTVDDYRKKKNSRPEDQILQIGDMFEHVSKEELWGCALEFKDEFELRWGDRCKILDMALHMDEETPHVHIRRVWSGITEDGYEKVSQNLALEQLGIEAPDPDAPISRYNNAKITISKLEKSLFVDICKRRGIELEEHQRSYDRHLTTNEFKTKKALEHEIEMMGNFIEQSGFKKNFEAEFLEAMNEKERKEKYKKLKLIMEKIKKEVDAMHRYIDKHRSDFEYSKNPDQEENR